MKHRRPYSCVRMLLVLPPLLAACADLPTAPPADEAGFAMVGEATAAGQSLQATPPGFIRIGVVQSAREIRVGSESDFVVKNKATGAVLGTGSGEEITVKLLAAGEIRTRDWLQVTCTGLVERRDALVAAGLAAGFEVDTEKPSCWRVMYGSLPPRSSAAARAAFSQQLAAAGLPSTGFWWTARTTVVGESQLQFGRDGEDVLLGAPLVVESADGLVTIEGRTYRGIAEVWTNSSGTMAGINELPLEEYVYGVVPRELPPVPYGLPEAQKAQAVAARTYAVANLGSRSSDGYDVVATTGHQVYGGYEDEHPVSTAAVDATRGIVGVHDGTLITTLYHSTSGGWTANSEDVYRDPYDYLRGVPDAERGNALEHVPSLEVFKRHANPTNLRAHAEGDFESDWSRYHRWAVEWTAAELATILAGNLGEPITRVDTVRVTDRADQGRVRRIEFVTDAGTFDAHKDAIRWTLQYYDVNKKLLSLRSTLFFIEEIRDPRTKELTGWKAYGGGWGHGVGMSQTGAVGMAKRGRTYEEILRHYYRGVELERR